VKSGAPLIHLVLGKLNQKDEELIANLEAFLKIFSPGQLLKLYLKATMGPSIKLKI
jgi:ribosomal protein L1